MQYKFIKVTFPVDLKENVWQKNPQLKYIEPYKKLYETDSGGEESSLTLKCIMLDCDPSYDNKIGKLEDSMKRNAILAYNPKFDFEDELVLQIKTAYVNDCLTPAARAFKIEEDALIKRAKFIESAEYTFPEVLRDNKGAVVYAAGKPVMMPGTARDIDAMRKLTLDIYKKYEMVKKMFEDEQKGVVRLYGGGEETLMDEGGLIELQDDMED